jgi:hypothetical protein
MRATSLALAAFCSFAVIAGCGGDDDGDGSSAADLKKQLLPESQLPGLKVERAFEWDDAVDAAIQGLPIPFEGPHGTQEVVELASDDDARAVLDFAHEQGLKQPCFAVCSVDPREMAVDGIPGAKGVQLLPLENPPPNAPPPFQAYAVGFTVGPRFYFVGADGGPGQVKKDTVLDAAKRLYARNKDSG